MNSPYQTQSASHRFSSIILCAAAMVVSAPAVNAETLRWARVGDALTLDPHSANEGPT